MDPVHGRLGISLPSPTRRAGAACWRHRREIVKTGVPGRLRGRGGLDEPPVRPRRGSRSRRSCSCWPPTCFRSTARWSRPVVELALTARRRRRRPSRSSCRSPSSPPPGPSSARPRRLRCHRTRARHRRGARGVAARAATAPPANCSIGMSPFELLTARIGRRPIRLQIRTGLAGPSSNTSGSAW
jgi:hypothetical protein